MVRKSRRRISVSTTGDIAILLKTVVAVVRGTGSY